MPHPSQAITETHRKPDGWSRDKSRIISWAAAALGTGLISWVIWATVAVFNVQQAAAVDRATICANEAAARERDKQIAEIAAQAQAITQTQLAQIQAQLADIQRELRRQVRP